MTADELLLAMREAGVVLEARGGRLHVRAPLGVITPTLREELTRRKTDLLILLTAVPEFVYLSGGLTVPLPAFWLALHLEHRGFAMSLDDCLQVHIEPWFKLSAEEKEGIRRWRDHLGAIIAYDADQLDHPQ